jgi:hypothetical protein
MKPEATKLERPPRAPRRAARRADRVDEWAVPRARRADDLVRQLEEAAIFPAPAEDEPAAPRLPLII